MHQFWKHGYEASSMGDLVRATGVSRHGLYAEYPGKYDLFVACLDLYQDNIVTPAFEPVEHADATLDTVSDYYNYQIAAAEQEGLPGPGCLVANTMTELAADDAQVRQRVLHHTQRLTIGFSRVIRNELKLEAQKKWTSRQIKNTANIMVIFTQGLWSASRAVDDVVLLHDSATQFLSMIHRSIH